MRTALWVLPGPTTSNFIWQALFDKDWETAFERSFFQVVALFVYVTATRLVAKKR